jgi:IS30 family transposase
MKKSKYISKSKRSQIEKMNDEKVAVEEILRILSKKRGQ